MVASKEYPQLILDRLSGPENITHRQMMGEYIIYYKGDLYENT